MDYVVLDYEEGVVDGIGGNGGFVESCERGVHFFGVCDSVAFPAVVVVNAHVEDQTFLDEEEDGPECGEHEDVFYVAIPLDIVISRGRCLSSG